LDAELGGRLDDDGGGVFGVEGDSDVGFEAVELG
jgi:hypothetical protein